MTMRTKSGREIVGWVVKYANGTYEGRAGAGAVRDLADAHMWGRNSHVIAGMEAAHDGARSFAAESRREGTKCRVFAIVKRKPKAPTGEWTPEKVAAFNGAETKPAEVDQSLPARTGDAVEICTGAVADVIADGRWFLMRWRDGHVSSWDADEFKRRRDDGEHLRFLSRGPAPKAEPPSHAGTPIVRTVTIRGLGETMDGEYVARGSPCQCGAARALEEVEDAIGRAERAVPATETHWLAATVRGLRPIVEGAKRRHGVTS